VILLVPAVVSKNCPCHSRHLVRQGYGSYGVFWTIPSEYFGSRAAPGGLALINTIGLLGGFASPACIGWVKSLTHSLDAPLLLLACVILVSALGLLALRTRLNMTENSNQEIARLESH
jgi:nitrate/nitrite transporter NarK